MKLVTKVAMRTKFGLDFESRKVTCPTNRLTAGRHDSAPAYDNRKLWERGMAVALFERQYLQIISPIVDKFLPRKTRENRARR